MITLHVSKDQVAAVVAALKNGALLAAFYDLATVQRSVPVLDGAGRALFNDDKQPITKVESNVFVRQIMLLTSGEAVRLFVAEMAEKELLEVLPDGQKIANGID